MSTLFNVIELRPVNSEARSEHCAFLLGRVGKVMSRRFAKALGGTGLKPPQAGVLMTLHERGPLTQQALGELMHIDPSNLVGVLNEVEESGWAIRRRDPSDRRRHIVEISKEGTKLVARIDEVVTSLEAEMLSVLDDREKEQLRQLLVRVVDAAADDGLETEAA